MDPKWTPKGTPNPLKSAKMLPRTPPEWVWRPGLEKVASRTLPEPPSCAENIAPAILFTLPRRCPQDRFGLHFGSILAPFWAPWAPKSRPRGEKDAFQKSINKKTAEKVIQSRKKEPQKGLGKAVFHTFFHPRNHLRPRIAPDPERPPQEPPKNPQEPLET